MGEASLIAAVAARVLGVLGLASRPAGDNFRRPPALNLRGGWLWQRAGGPRRRYCAAILLHCASASCLSEAIGIFAAAG
jgi:hypothetical protein